MSIGPQGNWVSGIVGAQAGHQRSSEVERKSLDSAQQVAASQMEKASAADGSLRENEAADDRDGDGRDLSRHLMNKAENKESDENQTPASDSPPKARDVTGHVGRNLDLTG